MVYGPLTAVARLAAAGPLTIEVLKPALVTNSNLTGEKAANWAAATVVASLKGSMQPASLKALERAGRTGAVGVWAVITTPGVVTPLGRIRINTRQYTILDVAAFGTHDELLVEEVSP